MEELHARIWGRVQLVMFRDFAQRKARTLKLVGTVKNLRDGSVEVVAQGPHEVLESFVAKLRRGPLLARVDDIELEWRTSSGQVLDDFRIIY